MSEDNMKTNIKKIMTVLSVVATMSFTTLIKAEEVSLPVISRPAALEEGIQRELSKEQIAELLPWAKDSKFFLTDLLESVQGNNASDKVERLTDGIVSVVGESAPKRSELLMRYVLNRGLVLNKILSEEMNGDTVGTVDAKLRVLTSSIAMAIKYYDVDMSTLQKKSNAPFAKFGMVYFKFLNELNKSIFDASAQYQVQRVSLEWFQWDLYRDVNNASYAPQIVKINNALKIFPVKRLTDTQSITYIRQMKALAQQLGLSKISKETLATSAANAVIQVGERAIYISNNESKVVSIAAIQDNGDYVIRHNNDALQSNISRTSLAVSTGCGEKFCVGEKTISTLDNNAVADIRGILTDGSYVARYYSGSDNGKISRPLREKYLVKLTGCVPDGYCVGDSVIHLPTSQKASIIGINSDNSYTIQMSKRSLEGLISTWVQKSNLARDGEK